MDSPTSVLISILILITLIQFIVIISLWKKPKPKARLDPAPDRDSIIIDWLELVMRQPNPFIEIIRHSEAVHTDQASALDGTHTIDYLFQELDKRGKLRQIESYNSVVSFNPSLHRSLEQLVPGESVLVIDPGWKFNAKIFKYPVVTSIERKSS